MLVGGSAVGLAHGVAVGDPVGQAVRLLARQPPVRSRRSGSWPAIVLVLFGWLPRAAVAVAWSALVAFIVLGEFGALWQLPTWVLDLSPFAHSPRLPGGPVEVTSVAGLIVVAAVIAVAGFAGWRRRDLTT